MDEIFGVSFYYFKCSDDNVDILRKVELTDKQKVRNVLLNKEVFKNVRYLYEIWCYKFSIFYRKSNR